MKRCIHHYRRIFDSIDKVALYVVKWNNDVMKEIYYEFHFTYSRKDVSIDIGSI